VADVTLAAGNNSYSILKAALWVQRAGNWSLIADEIDAESPPAGQVTIDWQGTALRGYVLRSRLEDGLVSAVIFGGAGGLTKPLQPKMYDYQLPARMVAEDIVNQDRLRVPGGDQETLSATAAPALLQTMASWVRRSGDGGEQLSALCDALGVLWRVQLDGSIFVGTDSYQPVQNWEHDVPQGGWHSTHGCLEVVPSGIGALPGQRYEREVGGIVIAGRIGAATYTTGPEGPGARLYFVDDRAPQSENAAEPLRAFVRETMRGVELLGTFTGKVALQRTNGTLDVYPDDQRLPPMTSVRLRVPVPGAKLRVLSGSRCHIVFEGGDVRQPVATLYEPGGATRAVVRVGDQIDCGTLTITSVAMGVLSGTYVDPFGATTPFSAGTPIPLKGKPVEGSPDLSLP
jgi:hypothetical protein